ncbi:hypothetical protein GGI23_001587, partial [Coemansia sp. RSA 2559]
GQNFAVATKEYYGTTERVTLLQIVGGATGTQIEAMETDHGFDYITVRAAQPTRTCTTCLDAATGTMTEMVGVSGVIGRDVEAQYERIATELLRLEGGAPRVLVLCGTFPPGLQAAAVARIVEARVKERTLVFVDAVQDIHAVLATRCIDILKVNSGEALSILDDRQCKEDPSRQADLAAAAMALASRYAIETVAVTDGPSTAYIVDKGACYAVAIPDLAGGREHFLGPSLASGTGKLTLNPLGAGDTCSAVMVNQLLDGTPMVEAFALGLAAASASCLVLMPNCVFDRSVMRRIRAQITVTKCVCKAGLV